MGIIDLILFPTYVLLFYFLFAMRRNKMEDPVLKKYHVYGFWIKVFSCLAFTVFNYYISIGDSILLYFDEGINIRNLIIKHPSQINLLISSGKDFDEGLLFNPGNQGYFASESNFFICRLVAFLSFFSFGRYLIINLFFSMISFAGVWRLYKFFYSLYPHLHRKMAIAILFLPTFVFWGSGILKDPICAAMMGFLTFALYELIIKGNKLIRNILVATISGYLLGLIKPYILISYLPFLLLFLMLLTIKKLESAFSKIILSLLFVGLGLGAFFLVSDKLQEEMGSLAFDKITESVKTTQRNFIEMADQAESSFSLGVEFDGSTSSLTRMAPAAINATLFRPYIWESKKMSTLLSSLESLALMGLTFFTLIKAGVVRFFGSILFDPTVQFCFFFSMLFALFVGATTLNFGTLVRYKIPCMPFYIIAMVLILERKRMHDQQKKERAEKLALTEEAGS